MRDSEKNQNLVTQSPMKKIKEMSKGKIICALIYFAIVIITIVLIVNNPITLSSKFYWNRKAITITAEPIMRDVTGISGKLESLHLQYGTYVRTNYGKIIVDVLKNGKHIQEWITQAENLKDNQYEPYLFDESIEVNKNDVLTVSLRAEDFANGQSVAIWIGGNVEKIEEANMCMYFVYSSVNYMHLMIFFIAAILIFVILFKVIPINVLERIPFFRFVHTRIIKLTTRKKQFEFQSNNREAKTFLAIALLFGFILVILMPPFVVTDEEIHFINIWSISRGIFNERVLPTGYGSFISKNLYHVRWTGPNYEDKYSFSKLMADANFSLSDKQYNETNSYQTYIQSTGYTVSAFSMALGTYIGELFGFSRINNPYNQMQLGRIGNLLFYSIVIYYAIKRTPAFKRLMMLIGCMPMSLFLGASLSYDAMMIPVSLYYFALILSLCKRPNVLLKKHEIFLLILCVFFLVTIKYAYSPLILLLLAIPRTKYKSTKNLIFCIACAIAVGIIGLFFIGAFKSFGNIITTSSETAIANESPSSLQRAWLYSHLTSIPQLFQTTFEVKGLFYLESFWGVLGWVEVYLPPFCYFIGYLILFIVAFYEGCTFTIFAKKRWKNLLSIIASSISIICIALAMYISHTPLPHILGVIGGRYIEGVQGRYFIPCALPIVLFFSNSLLLRFDTQRKNIIMTNIACVWSVACGIITVFTVFTRYWI